MYSGNLLQGFNFAIWDALAKIKAIEHIFKSIHFKCGYDIQKSQIFHSHILCLADSQTC